MRWWVYLSRGLPVCADRDRNYSVIVENTLPIRRGVAKNICSRTTDGNRYPRISILSHTNVLHLLATSEFACHASFVICCQHYLLFFQEFGDRINWFAPCRSSANHLMVYMAVPYVFRLRCYQITDNGIISEFVIWSRCGAATSLLSVFIGI